VAPIAASAPVQGTRSADAAAAGKAAAQGPLEIIRERLATRLGSPGSAKPGGGTSRNVVQVSSSAPGEFRVQPGRKAGSGRAARASGQRSAAAEQQRHHRQWSYAGDTGPAHWGRLSADFELCGRGRRQSPIDIRDGFAVDLEPVTFDYRAGAFTVLNSGHTLEVSFAPGNRIELGGRTFELLQMNFRHPAEESVDGRHADMSAQLVHRDSEGRQVVVALQLVRGAAQPQIQSVWNNLPLEAGEPVQARGTIDPLELLPSDRRYFTYMGSLTTPPCTEGIQWIVLKQPVELSDAQVRLFARLYPMNARPVQAAAGRVIKQSP
jgi:carbonic anhydrase